MSGAIDHDRLNMWYATQDFLEGAANSECWLVIARAIERLEDNMATDASETTQQRYRREHDAELCAYADLTPEQIEVLVIARHNAEAQRDELLAALKIVNERFGPCRGEYIFSKRAALDKVAAAIAKAEA